jgi:putative cardiolipin synthase
LKRLRFLALALVAAIGALLVVRACHPLPSLERRSVSSSFTETDASSIGRAVSPLVATYPGRSGVHPLENARDAFAVRMRLADAADRSLDVQYYIWRSDLTGTLLLDALRRAADRGVRVRLLLDDNNTVGLDPVLAALDSHENIEVRLFNPFMIRWPRALGFLTDFFRLNRRMHNKSFTADNQATVIGGRNVGDEYFDADGVGELSFTDLDMLAVGPVVREVSIDFDRFWGSGSSYPAEDVLPAVEGVAADVVNAARTARDPAAAAYLRAIRESAVVAQMIEGTLSLEWVPVRMVSDDPAKGLGLAPPEALLWNQLQELAGSPDRKLDLVTPYFVPTTTGVDAFVRMARRGVQVRVLVNSLEATDVDAVHSGYAKWRAPLLASGVILYETRLAVPAAQGARGRSLGSSGSSLHAKTFAVDDARVFVGSFNFDPRSANLNTELGFVIESPALAGRLSTRFDERIPALAYQVHLENGELYWTERINGDTIRHDVEPGTTALQRVLVWLLSLFPLDPLL